MGGLMRYALLKSLLYMVLAVLLIIPVVVGRYLWINGPDWLNGTTKEGIFVIVMSCAIFAILSFYAACVLEGDLTKYQQKKGGNAKRTT